MTCYFYHFIVEETCNRSKTTNALHSRQISRVDDCKLTRVGDLEVDFQDGTCTRTSNSIIMCFPSGLSKRCYKGSDPFSIREVIDDTVYDYQFTYISSSEGLVPKPFDRFLTTFQSLFSPLKPESSC